MGKTRAVLVSIIPVVFMMIVFSANVLASEPEGKALYEKNNCKMCHGIDGASAQKTSDMLKVDLSKLNLIDKETTDKKDDELARVINDGAGKMKGFKAKMSAEEVASILKYVRSLKK